MTALVGTMVATSCALWPVLAAPATVTVTGPFEVKVTPGELSVDGKPVDVTAAATFAVVPPPVIEVRDEAIGKLPVYDPKKAGWTRGYRLKGVLTLETTARYMLEPESLTLKTGTGPEATVLERGKDWDADLEWGTMGRLEGGAIEPDQKVYASYKFGRCRLDSIVVDAAGKPSLKIGEPHINCPKPPELAAGEKRVVNVWVPGRVAQLTAANLMPLEESAYPEPAVTRPTQVEQWCPKTLAKLRAGGPIRVLAWGDSVTNGTFVGDLNLRWQCQFVDALKARFPKAEIDLVHLGWGGRNTGSFLAEPPGSQWNYQEKVVDSGADLCVMEFVNDAYLKDQALADRYNKILKDFQGVGMEWIILTPHYVRPDWMGLKSERDCDDDPRPYVKSLREWCPANQVPLADASLRWGRLWRQGIPYTTLLLNAINHPDGRGMKLFADALMQIFPPE